MPITIVEESKRYILIRMPRKIAGHLGFAPAKRKEGLTEKEILARSREAMQLHRKHRLPILRSLRDLA